jgi:8-oxo-dGTP diphosphatase
MKLKVAAKIILQHEGKILLMSDNGQWDFPGGGIEGDEQLPDALRRELREETGIESFEIGRVVHADEWFIAARGLHVVAVFYAGTIDSQPDLQLSGEHSEGRWVTPPEVRTMDVTPDTIRALEAMSL